jgi:hypothetical protein
MKRIAILNNLWQVSRTFFGMGSGNHAVLEDLLIDHNTAVPCSYSTYYFEANIAPALIRLRLTNNVAGFGSYGVTFAKPDQRLAPGAIVAKNALVNITESGDGQGAIRNVRSGVDQAMYMSFRNPAAAGLNMDGTLTATSPLRRAGSDGKDIGVDFAELQHAMANQSAPR